MHRMRFTSKDRVDICANSYIYHGIDQGDKREPSHSNRWIPSPHRPTRYPKVTRTANIVVRLVVATFLPTARLTVRTRKIHHLRHRYVWGLRREWRGQKVVLSLLIMRALKASSYQLNLLLAILGVICHEVMGYQYRTTVFNYRGVSHQYVF